MDHKHARERLVQASVEKAEALMAMGQMEQALKELEDAYRLAPELVAERYARALVQQAARNEEAGDVEGALTSYRRALQVASEGSALWQEIAAVTYRLEARLPEDETTGRPLVQREIPVSRVILWLVIMLAGWTGILGLSQFTYGNEWLILASWAMVGTLVGLAQWLVMRKAIPPVKPRWILIALAGWSGCWVLGEYVARGVESIWFVEAGRDVDIILQLNLWWAVVWQSAFLLSAIFNGTAAALLFRSRPEKS